MTQVFDQAAIETRLSEYPPWTLGADGMLHVEYVFASFAGAMLFANAVAYLAEAADHHPDMCIHGYRHLSIRLMSHSAGGVTERDFALVAQINALPRPE